MIVLGEFYMGSSTQKGKTNIVDHCVRTNSATAKQKAACRKKKKKEN